MVMARQRQCLAVRGGTPSGCGATSRRQSARGKQRIREDSSVRRPGTNSAIHEPADDDARWQAACDPVGMSRDEAQRCSDCERDRRRGECGKDLLHRSILDGSPRLGARKIPNIRQESIRIFERVGSRKAMSTPAVNAAANAAARRCRRVSAQDAGRSRGLITTQRRRPATRSSPPTAQPSARDIMLDATPPPYPSSPPGGSKRTRPMPRVPG